MGMEYLDAMLQDAELGIDRETTDLVAMLDQKQQGKTKKGRGGWGKGEKVHLRICIYIYKVYNVTNM